MIPRQRLQQAAVAIAARYAKPVSSPWQAARKLFIARRYRYIRHGDAAIQDGWKRGELCEVAEAVLTGSDWREEWGDVGYYIAQTWRWLWWLYEAITPYAIIESAVEKFERRAN